MKRETAETLKEKILQVERTIDEMCFILRDESDRDEAKRITKILATALADISCDVLVPLAKQHRGLIDLGPGTM
jgi:hypothetical protein